MKVNFPTPGDRKHLLRAFYDLPPKDKEILYSAVEHLRWLTMLWDLGEASLESMPSISEKRHILLAYKLLQLVWFTKLPEKDDSTFTVYVRDRLPEDQDPAVVTGVFDTPSDELAGRCYSLTRPGWITKQAKRKKTSLISFPYEAS